MHFAGEKERWSGKTGRKCMRMSTEGMCMKPASAITEWTMKPAYMGIDRKIVNSLVRWIL